MEIVEPPPAGMQIGVVYPQIELREIRARSAGSGGRSRTWALTTCSPTTTCSVPFTPIERPRSRAPIPSTTRSTTRS